VGKPQDGPNAAGVTRIEAGDGRHTSYYFWETQDHRMCLGSASARSTSTTVGCAGPSAAERDHRPELRPLFGPGADMSAAFYLAFRIGHGKLASLSLAGKPVTAQWIRQLGPQVGGGDAYFLALPARPRHEKLAATITADGRQKTLTMDVDL
jgi:hypothetical protein